MLQLQKQEESLGGVFSQPVDPDAIKQDEPDIDTLQSLNKELDEINAKKRTLEDRERELHKSIQHYESLKIEKETELKEVALERKDIIIQLQKITIKQIIIFDDLQALCYHQQFESDVILLNDVTALVCDVTTVNSQKSNIWFEANTPLWVIMVKE